jgi:hypothetical protein
LPWRPSRHLPSISTATGLQEFDRGDLTHGQTASAVAVDSRGNVLVAGNRPSNSGVAQIYVAKYDGLDGHLVWDRTVGVSGGVTGQVTPQGSCFARSIAVDSQDNVIVGGGASLAGVSDEDFETIKLDSDGNDVWAKSFGPSGRDEVRKVVIGPSDSVYVTGVTADQNGQSDNFATIKYSSGGTALFTKTFNYKPAVVNGEDTPTGLAVDTDGSFWVTGYSKLSGDFYYVTLKYDSAGTITAFSPLVEGVAGQDYQAMGIVLNSVGTAFVTGRATVGGNDLFYTVKYGSTGIPFGSAVYSSGISDHAGGARSIAIGPDDNIVVTGSVVLNNNFAPAQGVTIKYDTTGVLTASKAIWPTPAIDTGLSPRNQDNLIVSDTFLKQVIVDQANNVIVLGESIKDQASDSDIYVAKYSGVDGHKIFSASFAGDFGSDDHGVAGAVDGSGNIAITGTEKRKKSTSGGIDGIATFKYQRILAETGDELPVNPTNQKARKITALNAPSLADAGSVAVRITEQEGTAKFGAILTQLGAGGSQLPFVQGQSAPNVPGYANATFASFGEPLTSPNGNVVFPAKLAGGVPLAKAKTVWSTLGGSPKMVLQQGTPLPGLPSAILVSVTSLSVRDAQILALVKVNGDLTKNVVLLSLDTAGTGTVLLRTGDPVTVNAIASNIKSITALTPAPGSPGDGRWQGDASAVAKVTLGDKRTVIYKVKPGTSPTPLLFTNQTGAFTNVTGVPKTVGLPAVATSGSKIAALVTLNLDANPQSKVTAADDTVLVADFGAGFAKVAREGDASGIPNANLAGFSDPVTNPVGLTAFTATLKAAPGSPALTAANNKALFYGVPGIYFKVARTGDPAPGTTAKYSAITAFALPGGTLLTPVFVAKLAGPGVTAANNVAVFARDNHGDTRRLLRTGDKLGQQKVTKITLLKAVPQEFGAARSFNKDGGVVMLVSFADHSTGILRLDVP